MGRPVFWYLSDWNAHGGHSLDGWGFHYEAWEEAQVVPTGDWSFSGGCTGRGV